MPERSRVVAALNRLVQVFSPTLWTTPLDLSSHRDRLADRVRRADDSPYREAFEFSVVDIAPTRASASEVLAVSASLPSELRNLVVDHVEATLEYAEAIAIGSDERISAWAVQHSGLPSDETIAEASRILSVPLPDPDPPTEGAEAVLASVKDALARHGIEDWHVSIEKNMSARMSVKGSENLIKVRSDIRVSEREMRRLVAHEVGGHVLRWVNSRKQPEPLAGFSFGSSTATEEGLAALLEEELGLSSPLTLHTYALRVLGVVWAQERDLVGLVFALSDHTTPDAAAELALRIRRGIADPGFPGGMTKEHSYLSGLLALSKLPDEEIALLRGVKWSLEHLDLIRSLAERGRIRPPILCEFMACSGPAT